MYREAVSKADTELIRQLEDDATNEEPVVAIVRLQPDDPSQLVPTPERTEQLTRQVLQRVREHVGGCEIRHNIFRNLGYFVVSADKPFLRVLLSQPEVATAVANVRPGHALIPIVEKRLVPPTGPKEGSRGAKKGRTTSASRKAASKTKN